MNPQDLIERVRRSILERDRVMEELYRTKSLRENAVRYILSRGGTKDDALTIYSDVIINFVKNCLRSDFKIKSSLENYFFGVTKNLWYQTIRERKQTIELESIPHKSEVQSPEIILIDLERRQNLEVVLKQLDEKCRKVLTLWARNMRMKAIASQMNYSSPEMARKKKHYCLKRLIELVNQHPELLNSLKK